MKKFGKRTQVTEKTETKEETKVEEKTEEGERKTVIEVDKKPADAVTVSDADKNFQKILREI